MPCFICDTAIPDIGSFRHWSVVVAHDQNYLGKCVVALRRHEADFLALTKDEREEMWEAAGVVREALARCALRPTTSTTRCSATLCVTCTCT